MECEREEGKKTKRPPLCFLFKEGAEISREEEKGRKEGSRKEIEEGKGGKVSRDREEEQVQKREGRGEG